MVDDGEFELEKNKKPKALRLEFVSKGLVIAGDIAGPAPAAPPSAQLLQDAIQDAIEQEMKNTTTSVLARRKEARDAPLTLATRSTKPRTRTATLSGRSSPNCFLCTLSRQRWFLAAC